MATDPIPLGLEKRTVPRRREPWGQSLHHAGTLARRGYADAVSVSSRWVMAGGYKGLTGGSCPWPGREAGS